MRCEPGGAFWKGILGQALDRELFARRLKWLQKRWRFAPMAQTLAALEKGQPSGLATLTFDDAYRDFLTVIPPVLRELNIPALFYITVQPLEQRELLWFDQVYSSFVGATVPEVTLRTIENRRFMLDTMAHRRLSANTVCGILAQVEDPLRREIVAEVVNKLGPGPFKPKELYLSRSELEELASQPGVEIGSHTLSHPNLTLLSDSKLRAELEESRSILSQIVGYEIRHLSYPNNAWDERVADMAKACGYSSV